MFEKLFKCFNKNKYADSKTIDESEKKYYKPDDYYTLKANEGTMFEKKVITFEERKEKSFPSQRGLYVGEIILLYCCDNEYFPNPEKGYPGYLWFKYGIRDVGKVLRKLQNEGFIEYGVFNDNIKKLKLDKLKEIANCLGINNSCSKSELIDKLLNNDTIGRNLQKYIEPTYRLTELGKKELMDNYYVVYMHKHKRLTIEGLKREQGSFTVWDVNKLLHDKDMKKWKEIVAKYEYEQLGISYADKLESAIKKEVYENDEMKQFIQNLKIDLNIKRDEELGFQEEMKGISYKDVGDDKNALIHFYKSISYKFDAPALYEQTAILLRKYKMYEEELKILEIGQQYTQVNGITVLKIDERIEKVKKIIEKNLKNK